MALRRGRHNTPALTVVTAISEVPVPPRILVAERAEALTPRQRELLDRLVTVFDGGFADLTMLELSKRLRCSLRTLYALASSRDELMLAVVEHYLDQATSAASVAVSDDMSALEALETYLYAVRGRLNTASEEFARDLGLVPGVEVFVRSYLGYRYAVIRALLDLAVDQGEIPRVDTSPVARVLSELAWNFTRPAVRPTLQGSPRDAHDLLVEVVISGLRAMVRDTNERGDAVATQRRVG